MLNKFTVSTGIFTSIIGTLAVLMEPIAQPIEPIDLTPYDNMKQIELEVSVELLEEEERIKQLSCLAMTVWGEARSESLLGQRLVANVILNRVDSSRYPDTICEVVYQPWQFSMWNKNDPNGKLAIEAFGAEQYDESVLESIKVSMDKYRLLPRDAVHYHTKAVAPKWKSAMNHYETVGAHIFYTKAP